VIRASYVHPIPAYRAMGRKYLRRARALSVPRKMGRPKAGEVRAPPINDRDYERRRALRKAREWFTMTSRYVLVRRVTA
jgi:hypothetical protein